MNIDRHNYEDYFLLYVDNELSIDQKKRVELFIKENPDLEEELVMLGQSKLVPDNSIVFDNKALLLKNGSDSFINLDNYEQWLILYVDNELTNDERLSVENFADKHVHVREDLVLFGKTKLETEKVIFPNKNVLFRHERAAVVTMRRWKIAVAAILIMAAGISLYQLVSRQGNGQVTNARTAKTDARKTPIQEPPSSTTAKSGSRDNHQPNVSATGQDEQLATATYPRKGSNREQRAGRQKDHHENSQQLAINLPAHNSDVPHYTVSESIEPKTEQARISNAVVTDIDTHKKIFNTEPVTKRVVETPESNIDPSIADNGENKKLRGFFRKATRLIERTTNINPANDDNKVLIGGMAINLK